MDRPTRRNAIRRGLLSLGGLVGLGAGARAAAGAAGRAVAMTAPSGRGTITVTLVAPDVSVQRASRQVPDAAQASAGRSGLLDGRGRPAGELHVTTMPVLGPGASSPDAGAMEWHAFHLPGGTILGAGSAGTDGGAFAVVGGTGRYAGARGTYEMRRLATGGAQFALRLEP
jgi:hypothetical protein